MKFLILSLFMISIFSIMISAQSTTFKVEPNGKYITPLTVFNSDSTQIGGDTSDVVVVPFEVKEIVWYLRLKAVSTGDSLSTASIQVSADKTNWVASTYSFAEALVAGTQRVVQAVADRYCRLIFTTRGTAVKIGLELIAVPK